MSTTPPNLSALPPSVNAIVECCGGRAFFGVGPVAEEMVGIADGGFDLDIAVAARQPVPLRVASVDRILEPSSEAAHRAFMTLETIIEV